MKEVETKFIVGPNIYLNYLIIRNLLILSNNHQEEFIMKKEVQGNATGGAFYGFGIIGAGSMDIRATCNDAPKIILNHEKKGEEAHRAT